ncbi:hypothetical protein JDV02_005164 [Purpureocillium takamizusanense]|uniref:DNA (cytosine-5)-methyltransferase 1 replication foci domain-containing protein n=1 Tax=Purpureocillium takamizusanense TaxID=2060973 RepID=A0A9Q8VA28_9HYPO|nr:uncharacterized protein JDV02_005164 [Purpureocillium takamizusanense]UNI18935.1 hypothetical protein JDV02_005164 [Purpureocillium takamizusanense]
MVGRRRRASTSSVESVDESQIRWRQEVSVVRSVPKDQSPDDWPIFELRDAVVLNKDGQSLENALHVGIRGPFLVRGNLIIDDVSQRSHLIMRVRSSTPIEIRQCITYSIGESPDGQPIIWVSGKGGWYEINPAPRYRELHRKMCEATTLYYTLQDIYSEQPPRKAKKTKPLDLMDELSGVFFKYALSVGDGSTVEEVMKRCHEHAGFFISKFQQDPFGWSATAFCRWLTAEHAVSLMELCALCVTNESQDLVKTIKDVLDNPRKLSPVPSTTALSPIPQQSLTPFTPKVSADSPSQNLPKRSSSIVVPVNKTVAQPTTIRASRADANVIQDPDASTASQPVVLPAATPAQPSTGATDGDDTPLASVLRALDIIYDEQVGKKRGLLANAVISKLYFAYKFPTYKDGTSGCYKVPVKEVLHYHASDLLRTLDASKWQSHEFWSFLQELSRTEFQTAAYKMSDFPVGMVPRKQMSRVVKQDHTHPQTHHASGSRADDDDASDSTPAPHGKGLKGRPKSSLRPISTKKRPRSQFETDSESEEAGAKKSHFFSDEDDAMDGVLSAGVVANGAPQTSSPEPIPLVIRAEKIPSTVPHGPEGTWLCDQDGCDYIVRGGDDCQTRIRDHFRDHEQQLERVSLAVTESRGGHMPINHLLEKIKRLGDRSQQHQADATGLAVPQPIKRKLIV